MSVPPKMAPGVGIILSLICAMFVWAQANAVVINEFELNPAGTDAGNEWVELYNPGASPVDISSWTVSTTQGTPDTITVPFGTVIPAGSYWTYTHSTQWLDNTDESLVLRDSTGTEIDRTLTASDGDNDDNCWARYPNGRDTDSDSDWRFQASTQGASNGNPILAIEKTDSPDPVEAGNLLLYTLTYSNVGDDTATNVTITEDYDHRVTFVSATPPPDVGDTLWNIGDLEPDSSGSIEITVQVNTPLANGSTLRNDLFILAQYDIGDTTWEKTRVSSSPELEAYKLDRLWSDADSNGEVSGGDTIRYEITIENIGNDAATGVSYSDTPDPNSTLAWGTVTTTQGIVTLGNNSGDLSVAVDVGTIAGAGGTVEITYKVTVNDLVPLEVTELINQGIVSSNELPDEPTDYARTSTDDDPTSVPLGEVIVQFCADPQVTISKPDTTFTICLTVDNIADVEQVVSIYISLSFDTTLIWFDSIYTFVSSCLDSSGWHFKWQHPGGDYSQLEIWLIGGGTGQGLDCEGCLVWLEFLVDASAVPGDSTYILFDELMINEGLPYAIGCDILLIVNRSPEFVTTFDDTTYLIEKHEFCVVVEAFDPDGDSLIMWSILDPYPCDGAEPDPAYGRGSVFMQWCWTPPKPGTCDTLQDTLIVMSTFETGQPLYDTLTTTFVVLNNLVDVFWPDTAWHACGCLEVPLYIMQNLEYNNCLDSLDILSFDLILDYDPGLLTVFEVGNEGLITEQWGAMQFRVEGGMIYVSMGGNHPLSYCDTVPTPLIYVGFCVNEEAEIGNSAFLSVDHVKFNEGWPTVYWWNGSMTVIDYAISGTVTYCDNGFPVPGVEVKISNEWPAVTYVDTVYTDTLGFYEITGVEGCTEYCLKPQKHNLPGQVVTSFDGSLLLRSIVGSYSLSGCDSLAADVSQDGTISAYDASLILRWVVCGDCAGTASHAGEWMFVPDHRCYDDLDSSSVDQDYTGIIGGDVSQNYPGDGPPKVVTGDGCRVSLRDVSGSPGERFVVPVMVENADGIFSVDMVVRYDPRLLTPVDVDTTSWTAGFLSAFHAGEGVIRIGLAGARGLRGRGPLAEITFSVSSGVQQGTNCPLELTVWLNEGTAPAVISQGMFTVGRLGPDDFGLAQNYPNPFNPTTHIRFAIPSRERRAESGEYAVRTTLKIYNLLGQKVRTLVDEAKEPGYYTVTWDGRDERGDEVSSGIYFYRMRAGPFSKTRRMVLLK